MKSGTMREIDHGWKRIKETVIEMKNKNAGVKVGVLGDGNERNALVAMWNEFGTVDIPERSFLRSTIAMLREKYVIMIGKGMGRVIDGTSTVYKVLDLLGIVVANDIKNRVKAGSGIPPPNAPGTIAKKGSSHTLIDTAQMVNSISHKVDISGGGGAKGLVAA